MIAVFTRFCSVYSNWRFNRYPPNSRPLKATSNYNFNRWGSL